MLRSLWTVSLFFLAVSSFSQKVPLIHSGEVIEKGKVLYDSSKYAEAIKEYLKVPERDTNYVLMLTEAALAYIASEQYDKVLTMCEKGIVKPSKYTPYFLRYQAIAEDKRGNFDKSVQLFEAAIKRYPADYGLLYNLGITHYNNKQYDKAADIFFRVLSINPFHSGSHLNLGRISIGQGRKVHAMLSLGIYLSISNTDNPRLVLLNNFLDNQVTDEGSIPVFGSNEPEKLDQIIRAKIAMDKNFKSKIPVEAVVVRQYEMFFEQMNTISGDTDDRWIKTYLPIYRFMQAQNLVEPFIYHLLSSSSNSNVKKWLSKNEKSLKSFFGSVNTIIKKQREVVSAEVFGFSKPVQAWYDSDNKLDALGESTADIRKGHWVYYHDNHQLSAEGDYTDQGIKKGIWKYYNNDGTVKSIEDYSTGEVTVYFPDGIKREHFYLKNEVIHGDVELYFPCGPLKEKLKYEEGNRHGKGQTYHATGGINMTYQYISNKANGEFKTYYENGNSRTVSNYKDDKLTGSYQSYHPDQKPESQGQYMNDQAVGLWAYYDSKGRIERKGGYNNEGEPNGEWIYYDAEGLVTERRQFDDEGRLHGTNSHFYAGKPHYADTYKKGVLIQSVFYNPEGKEIGKYGSGDGSFATRNYFATGQLQSEGNYIKGKANGVWKYYNRYGKLISEYNYVQGKLQGKATDYYPSGEKKYIMEYKDNELHGYFQEYYRHGSLKQEGWFQNGNREQQWLSYYPDGTLETDSYYLFNSFRGQYFTYSLDGKLFSLSAYENDKLTDIKNYDSKGTVKTVRQNNHHVLTFEDRYQNKKLKSKFELLCGNYVGALTKWYPDGTVYYTYSFLNGKKEGPYLYNDISGKPGRQGQYVNDQEEGFWKSFHYTGKLSQEGLYLNGSKDSVWNFFFPDGKISSSITYRKNEPHGEARYYSPEGVPLLDKLYHDGDMTAYRTIKPNGETGPWMNFSGNQNIAVNNAAGKVVYEETFKDGMRHGYKRLYFDNGKLCEEYHYNMGDFEGPYTLYYANGKLLEKGTFKNDEREGKLETFLQDGTPQKIENYRMGSRHGKTIVYTKGASRKEFNFWDGVIEE